jgi:KDO2-lipid IV(A) lauroyltransferase
MDKVIYAIAYIFSLLPLRVLYLFSDFCYVIVYHIVGYRKKTVRKNLKNSFSEKSDEELRKIEKDFYLYFCDTFFETVKAISMSDKEMSRRFTFDNMDIIDQYCDKGKNIILYLGHYGNWEWLTFARKAYNPRHPDYECVSVYHKLENKVFDKFYLRLRSKSNSTLVPQEGLLRKLVTQSKAGKLGFYCFIADQGTMWKNMYFWMDFLNQETAPIVGPEKIAKQTGFPVLYIDVQKKARGYYHAKLVVMTESAKDMPEFELTKQYMRLMEATIKRDPAYWLWTHDRWKRKRETLEKMKKIAERNEMIKKGEISLTKNQEM